MGWRVLGARGKDPSGRKPLGAFLSKGRTCICARAKQDGACHQPQAVAGPEQHGLGAQWPHSPVPRGSRWGCSGRGKTQREPRAIWRVWEHSRELLGKQLAAAGMQ